MKDRNQICLTIEEMQAFISFCWRALHGLIAPSLFGAYLSYAIN